MPVLPMIVIVSVVMRAYELLLLFDDWFLTGYWLAFVVIVTSTKTNVRSRAGSMRSRASTAPLQLSN